MIIIGKIPHTMPLAQRLEFHSIPEPNTGCYLWIGHASRNGYGMVPWENRKISAHRVAWEVFRGPIPSGMCVCHRCDVRLCVNPDHLFLGTHADNLKDMASKGRARPHGRRSLSSSQVAQIRADKRPNVRIAEAFGISPSTVSMIKIGKHHRHV